MLTAPYRYIYNARCIARDPYTTASRRRAARLGGTADVNEVARLGLLKDLYEGLLSPRQREVATLKLDEDLSFSEIARELGISRGAAQDAFQSCVEALNRFEQEIGFLRYSQEVNGRFETLKKLLESMDQSNWVSVKAEALRLLKELTTASG